MRKEYNDLNDKQKLFHIKRNVVVAFFMIAPLFIGAYVLLGTVDELKPHEENTSVFSNNGTHTIRAWEIPQELTEEEEITEFNLGIILSLAMILVIGGTVGLMYIGGDIGTYIADKQGWYTDFELERAKKRVTEIEEALK